MFDIFGLNLEAKINIKVSMTVETYILFKLYN